MFWSVGAASSTATYPSRYPWQLWRICEPRAGTLQACARQGSERSWVDGAGICWKIIADYGKEMQDDKTFGHRPVSPERASGIPKSGSAILAKPG